MISSLTSCQCDDKDLDDVALWAVIDSAEASHSSSKSKRPPDKFNQDRRQFIDDVSPKPDLQIRAQKIARSSISEVGDNSMTVPNRIASFSFPEAYVSPQIGRGFITADVAEASPPSFVQRDHCLDGRFPSVSLFKEYQNAAMQILEKSDYTMISGNTYIKKSGWRKISFYFNLSFEIKDRTLEFDENRNVQRAEFVVRAYMQGGRFCDGWGSCERREKRFSKPNHDVPSIAETRAKNRACQDLLGIGEYRNGTAQVKK